MRVPRTRERVRRAVEGPKQVRGERHRKGEVAANLTKQELMGLVCRHFCEGHSVSEIVKKVKEEFGVTLSRERPYQIFSYAAMNGWIRYIPPRAHELQEEAEERYQWLAGNIRVVHTPLLEDVAASAAQLIVDLMREHCRVNRDTKEMHIGLAGGYSVRRLGFCLAELFRQDVRHLPRRVVFHALAAGFPTVPVVDPNAFFLYLHRDEIVGIETDFVALQVPPIVKFGMIEDLKALQPIRKAFDEAKDIDIFVTSCASWDDQDSVFRQNMAQDAEAVKTLEANNVTGDLLWRPINGDGPIDVLTPIRAMTLVELGDLPSYVQKGKKVVLLAAPCAQCHRPKGKVLRAVLDTCSRLQLVTHVVADSRSVAEALDMPIPRDGRQPGKDRLLATGVDK